jgi:hypothetical protein
MKCFYCENESRAVCQFCGRFVCKDHAKSAVFYSGFGQKTRGTGYIGGTDTGMKVNDAVWCGACSVAYEKTY